MEVFVPVITATISGLVTLLVCLINNRYSNKKHMEDLTQSYFNMVDSIKTDYTGKIGELSGAFVEVKHSLDLINKDIKSLCAKQEAYNNLQARTYHLEKDNELQEERIKVANHRIKDLEATNRLRGRRKHGIF